MRDDTRDAINMNAVAAAELVKSLDGDDTVLIHDMVEGETDLFEAVDAALTEIRECTTMQAGIATTIADLTKRQSRFKKRAERLRGLIDQAFQMAEIQSQVFSCETVTTKRTPPKLIITDESAIPSRFYEPQPPKLDRKALLDAAKSEIISGVEVSNGGTTIQIRRA